jgi:hypothetical protein
MRTRKIEGGPEKARSDGIRGGRRCRARAALGIPLLLLGLPAGAQPQPTLADVVGVYEGTWNNLTFASQGAARIRIEADGGTGTLGVDLDGNVFGLPDPPEVVFTGTIGSQSIEKPDDSVFGDVSCTGNPSAFTCTGNMINDFVLSGSITGGVSGDTIDTTYELELFGMEMANGTVVATKVPEPAAGLGASGALAALGALRRRRHRAIPARADSAAARRPSPGSGSA